MRYFELLDYLSDNDDVVIKNDSQKKDFEIEGFSAINEYHSNSLTWFRGQDLNFESLGVNIIIGPKDYTNYDIYSDTIFLLVENPRRTFFQVMNVFTKESLEYKTEKTAIIGKNCQISEKSYIGHHVVIGDNVTIGKNTIIHSNVNIYSNVTIGNDCIIHSGVVIGADGFGYEKDKDGKSFKIKHIGGVVIGNQVEVGANTCIDRGTLGNTLIKNNVKINNLCHIAHNCVIEEGVFITPCNSISGSCKIGKNTWISPNSTIIDYIHVGENCLIGAGATIYKNVPNDTKVLVGNPGKYFLMSKD